MGEIAVPAICEYYANKGPRRRRLATTGEIRHSLSNLRVESIFTLETKSYIIRRIDCDFDGYVIGYIAGTSIIREMISMYKRDDRKKERERERDKGV